MGEATEAAGAIAIHPCPSDGFEAGGRFSQLKRNNKYTSVEIPILHHHHHTREKNIGTFTLHKMLHPRLSGGVCSALENFRAAIAIVSAFQTFSQFHP